MESNVCLVTGGTSGIGRAVAVQLARQGAAVLLTGRDHARGEAAANEIRGQGGSAHFLPVDFASLASVRALAEEVRRRHDRLRVLVNNAGLIGGSARRLTVDGFEETFAVNHLAPFLLTALLRDLLAAGAPARVVTVSSDAHRGVRALDFDNLQGERRYKPLLAYCQSKLANVLFTNDLARRTAGSGVTATSLHPGVVRTRIWQGAGGVLGFVGRLAQVFMMSAGKSGAYVARLAVDPALEGVSGRYFHCGKESASSPASHDPQMAARLWEVSEKLVGL